MTVSDADRLRDAMQDAATILAAFVGLPKQGSEDPFRAYDPAQRTHVLVRREEVPEAAWRSSIMALDLLAVGLGLTDPDVPAPTEDLDTEAEAFLRERPS